MRIEWMEKYMKEAELLIVENQVELGLKQLNNLLYEEPGYGSLHNHIGWAYMYYTSEAEKAEQHFQLAIRFEKEFAPPYLHLGNLYIRTGRYAEGTEALKEGLSKPNANRVAILESMGHAYELKREFAKAIHSYKEAMSSTVGFEVATLNASIKRCRTKRLALFFSF